ncbi:MAG: RNA polymerase sigma-32 factor [Saprospiraceae bacterium]|jgi:RNA polymerase sigma-32 factor
MTTYNPTTTLPVAMDISVGQDAGAYMNTVNRLPILSAEQERDLAIRFRDNDDVDAARDMVMSHLRDVVKVARGFMGYGLPLIDLIQEGNIGLMKAVKRYDPEHGVRLVSYAVHWIKAEIYDYVLKNWRIVKVATTKAQRKLFFNLRKSKERLGWMTNDEVHKLADNLSVDTKTVREMESRLSGSDVSFDGPSDVDDDAPIVSPSQFLSNEESDPARIVANREYTEQRNESLSAALKGLDERSRDIVARRWLADDKPTLHDLADEYGVSAERIRQIEKRAMERMKDVIAA